MNVLDRPRSWAESLSRALKVLQEERDRQDSKKKNQVRKRRMTNLERERIAKLRAQASSAEAA